MKNSLVVNFRKQIIMGSKLYRMSSIYTDQSKITKILNSEENLIGKSIITSNDKSHQMKKIYISVPYYNVHIIKSPFKFKF